MVKSEFGLVQRVFAFICIRTQQKKIIPESTSPSGFPSRKRTHRRSRLFSRGFLMELPGQLTWRKWLCKVRFTYKDGLVFRELIVYQRVIHPNSISTMYWQIIYHGMVIDDADRNNHNFCKISYCGIHAPCLVDLLFLSCILYTKMVMCAESIRK